MNTRTRTTILSGLALTAVLALLVALMVAYWTAARADAAECSTGEITYSDGGSPLWQLPEDFNGLRTAIVGTFLWVQSDQGRQADEYEGIVSVEIPIDAISATICPDGVVTFNLADPTPDPIQPAPTVEVDLRELYPGFDLSPRLLRGIW